MKIVLTLCGVVLGGMLSMSVARAEVAPGAPTILVPTSQAHTSSVKPVIAGVTQTGTQVDVYIDQQFNGRATVQTSASATAAWSYTPFLNLSQGWHTVTAKAENAAGARSEVSVPLYVYIDLLVPAPTLLTPVVNADSTASQPWIVGLSKGGMTLEVWIDGSLNGQVEVGGTRAQTQSFKYRPFLPLSVGTHSVSIIGEDPFGGQAKPAKQQLTVLAATVSQISSTSVVSESEVAADVIAQPISTPTPESQPTSTLPTETQVSPPAPTADPVLEAPATPEDSQDIPTDTDAAVTNLITPDTTNTVDGEESGASKQENVLTTIGWVLLALVAIGMITRGRAKRPATDDQLVKIDTSDSNPHVEVIRKPVDQSPSAPSTPTTPPPNQPSV